jgi:hypothetical protein
MIVRQSALRRIDAGDSVRNRRSIGLNKCDRLDVGVTEDRRGQRIAEDGTDIDVEAIGVQIRLAAVCRDMSVHDQPPMIALVRQEASGPPG